MSPVIEYVAAGCGIGGVSLIMVIKYVKTHRFVWPRNHPNNPVGDGGISYIDVENGLAYLVEYARTYSPHYIFGINRGGAILGGMLAKRLKLPRLALIYVNCDLPENLRVQLETISTDAIGGKVLLVDDLKSKGEHMREAYQHLRRLYPNVEIRRIVLLEHRLKHSGAEKSTFVSEPVEKAAFYTYSSRARLPWDPN